MVDFNAGFFTMNDTVVLLISLANFASSDLKHVAQFSGIYGGIKFTLENLNFHFHQPFK